MFFSVKNGKLYISIACLAVLLNQTKPGFSQVGEQKIKEATGYRIDAVRIGWPAQQSGLERGDVISQVNDRKVVTEYDLPEAVELAVSMRKQVTVTVIDVRTGRELTRKLWPSRVDGKLGIVYTYTGPDIIKKVKDLFREKGFSPEALPKGEFDPGAHDPLPIYVTWNLVREDLAKMLGGDLRLMILNHGKHCRFVMFMLIADSAQRKAATKVLEQVLPLDDKSFVAAQPVMQSVTVVAGDLLPKYKTDSGDPNFSTIEKALVDYKRPGPLAGVEVTPVRRAGQYLYVRSAWRKLKAVKGGYYYRLVQGIRKHSSDEKMWVIFSWFDIVWLPNSEDDPDKFFKKTDTSAKNPDLADSLTIPVTEKPRGVARTVLVFVPVLRPGDRNPDWPSDNTITGPTVKNSSLLKLADEILKKTKKELCGEEGK